VNLARDLGADLLVQAGGTVLGHDDILGRLGR
jgi:ribulose 1,5-bisphosphate carboxylase large subunit-like protein